MFTSFSLTTTFLYTLLGAFPTANLTISSYHLMFIFKFLSRN